MSDPVLIRRIGERLQAMREAAGFTQAELADAIGIETETLSRYETGARGPSITTLAFAAEALGIPLVQLVDVEASPPIPHARPTLARLVRLVEPLDDHTLEWVLRVVREIVQGIAARSAAAGAVLAADSTDETP